MRKRTQERSTRQRRGAQPNDPLLAWRISEAEYPYAGKAWEQLRFCLNYGILAPSEHNTQPWRFKLGDDEIRLFADRTRALPVIDPADRELIMSCGAALFNVRLAIRYFGHTDQVSIFPDKNDSDLLAIVDMGPPRGLDPNERLMFHSIMRRHTNRRPFGNRAVPENLFALLREAADQEGCELFITGDEKVRSEITELVRQADCEQMCNASFRRELALWIHPGRIRTRDGMPSDALELHKLLNYSRPCSSVSIRTLEVKSGEPPDEQKLAKCSPVLALLTTETDTQESWLAAGQGLEHVLLLACASGLSASFLNQVVEIDTLRQKLREMLEPPGFPQALVRLGYGPEARPTPRRDISEVLI